MFAVPPSPPEVDEMTTLGATLSSVMITAPDIPVPPVPPAAVAAAVNMLTPSSSVTMIVQAPPVAIAVPIELPSLRISTTEPASAVPVSVNKAVLTVCGVRVLMNILGAVLSIVNA